MRLSTMTNLMMPANNPKGTDYIHSLRHTREAGFTVVDFNMCAMGDGESELNVDNWEELVYNIRNEAESLGIEFSQAHLPYSNPSDPHKTPYDTGGEQNEFFLKMIEQSIVICSILGVKWGVLHPVQQKTELEHSLEEDIRYNHLVYDRYIEMADKYNVGIAFENMIDKNNYRKSCATANDLAALVDDFNTPRVGACWDFGHGNCVYSDQTEAIKYMGKRIKATHVDDNLGDPDPHMLPFLGNIPWEKIMKTLTQIGYKGDFTYEISFNKYMPDDLKLEAGKFAFKVGQYLLSLA